MQATTERKRLNVVLSEDLHKKLKLTAIDQGVTMSDYVTKLLENALMTEDEQK